MVLSIEMFDTVTEEVEKFRNGDIAIAVLLDYVTPRVMIAYVDFIIAATDTPYKDLNREQNFEWWCAFRRGLNKIYTVEDYPELHV